MNLSLSDGGKEKTPPSRPVCLSLQELSKDKKIIFGHEIGSLTSADHTTSVYAERALIMAGKNDTVLLNHPVDKNYLTYLDKAGLGPEEIKVLESSSLYEGVQKAEIGKSDATYSPFISKGPDKEIQEKIATNYIGQPEEITMKYYDKVSFKKVCSELGIETAPGGVFERTGDLKTDASKLRSLIKENLALTGEAILRHSTGDGGFNILMADKNNIEKVVYDVLKDKSDYVVESRLPVKNSPCVIGLIDPEGPTLVAASSQILKNGTFFAGSILDYEAAVDKTIYNTFMKMGEKMHQDGYRGPFGIDFIETADGRKMPCECNARINGSFYPHEFRQNLFNKGMEFNVLYSIIAEDVKFKSFTELMNHPKAESLLYKGGKEPGIMPFNVSTMSHGTTYFVVLSNSHEEGRKLAREFKNILRNG